MSVFSKAVAGIGVCLVIGLSSNATLAAAPEADTADKTAEAPAPAAQAEVKQDPTLKEHPELVKTVEAYMTAWKAQDYDAMNAYESWEGGEPLKGFSYMQGFNADFGIGEWHVSRVIPDETDKTRFRVLVWLTHNPPKYVTGYVAAGTKVRSTIPQFWKQEGDKFVHLFHVEKKTFELNQAAPPAAPAPAPAKE